MSYIYEKFDYSMFEQRFRDYGRLKQFPTGLRALWDFLEGLAEDTGEPFELDVLALCCEFTEDDIESVLHDYGMEDIQELYDHTFVIEVDDETIIYERF